MHSDKSNSNGHIEIKAYSLNELRTIYHVSRATMRRWLRPFENDIGPYRGKYFTPAQVKIIFQKLGTPHTVDEKDI